MARLRRSRRIRRTRKGIEVLLPDEERELVGVEVDPEAPVPEGPHLHAEQRHQSGCSIVAHSPCSWRRNTSISADSRLPDDTTARPLWWTSSMSLVAFSFE